MQEQTSRPLPRPKVRDPWLAATQSEHAPQAEEHEPQNRDDEPLRSYLNTFKVAISMDEVADLQLQAKNKMAAVKAMQEAEKDLEAIRDFASLRLRTLQAKIVDEMEQAQVLIRRLDANEEDPEELWPIPVQWGHTLDWGHCGYNRDTLLQTRASDVDEKSGDPVDCSGSVDP